MPIRRNPLLVTHSVVDILRARMLAIACGYQDADDLDHLRTDPGFKLACGRLPDTGDDLCSQPTMSRWENAPSLREVVRMTYAMIDAYCASYPRPPVAVTLDIDDTVDVVHGHQQLSLFNAHYDERCSCRSTFTRPLPHARSWCGCGLARHHRETKAAVICVAWVAALAAIGRSRG